MLVKLKTFSLMGIDAVPVEVEVDCADIGMPKTILVGLPEAAVKESTYRIERAIENSGYFNPIHRTARVFGTEISLPPICVCKIIPAQIPSSKYDKNPLN